MYTYERSYNTGRAVCALLEIFGWVIVVLGVIVALAGFASGGFMGMASRNFGGSSAPFILQIVSMVPGVLVAAGGLISIMLAQQTKATMDTSEMTRELLRVARGDPKIPNDAGTSATMADIPEVQTGGIELFDRAGQPRKIEETDQGFILTARSGQRKEFATIEDVKAYIS